MNASLPSTVIPGLVLGTHVFAVVEDVDGRNKCGHDVRRGLIEGRLL
jgi:hypothetical protein